MGNYSWLTLSEMIHQGNLDGIEARRLVKKFGELLSPRNFGDIVKYPAPVADLLTSFISLHRQGRSIEDLKNLLIMTRRKIRGDYQARRSNLLAELQQESATLRKDLESVINSGSRMQEALRSIAHLMTRFDSLLVNMLDQQKERSALRVEGSLKTFQSESADQ